MAQTKKFAPSIRDPGDVYQRESRRIAETYNSTSLLNGILLTGVALTTGSTRVSHRLSRPYKGFLVVDKTVTGDVWRDATDTSRPEDAIPLKASTAMTVSIWVF